MAKKKAKHGGKREGAGRKPENPEGRTKIVTATVPESLVEELDEYAAGKDWNRSKAITHSIRRMLGSVKKR